MKLLLILALILLVSCAKKVDDTVVPNGAPNSGATSVSVFVMSYMCGAVVNCFSGGFIPWVCESVSEYEWSRGEARSSFGKIRTLFYSHSSGEHWSHSGEPDGKSAVCARYRCSNMWFPRNDGGI